MPFIKIRKAKKLYEILASFNTVREELEVFIEGQEDKISDLNTQIQDLQTEQAASMVVRSEAANVLSNLNKLLDK